MSDDLPLLRVPDEDETSPELLDAAHAALYGFAGVARDAAVRPMDAFARWASLRDPAVRARSITRILVRTQMFVEWMSERRNEAIREMREAGASYDQVAAALGITKSRAQQLCRRLASQD